MFCQNCGKNNEDGAIFCHYCGTRIIDNTAAAVSKSQLSAINVVVKNILSFVRKFRFVFIATGSLMILLIIFIIIGNILSSPARVAESYMDALLKNDYAKLYDTLDITENDFNSKEIFETSMHEYVESFNISNYDIEENSNNTSYASNAQSIFYQNSDMNSKSSDIVKVFRVTYATNASKTNTLNLQLIKQNEKFLLFFPTYKVQADNYITTVTLTAPEYASAYLDGILINEENSTLNKDNSYVDDGYNYYTLESVFAGVHTYEIKGDIIENYKCELSLKDSYYSETPDLILKDSVCTELENKAQNFISDFYNHTVAEDDFSSLEEYFTTDKSYLSEIENIYNSVKYNMSNSRNETVDAIVLHDFSVTRSINNNENYLSENNYTVNFTFTYDYEKTTIPYFSKNKKTEKVSSENPIEANGSVTFVYDGSDWKISYINVPNMGYIL